MADTTTIFIGAGDGGANPQALGLDHAGILRGIVDGLFER
jgi:hypothetical protein